jgi:cytochrome d ubiquinol oxidase subunit II
MGIDLTLLWFAIIIFATLMYVVMDGFDLGIGILMPLTKNKTERDIMVNTVAPVWDGNETWLVLGGAALFGAFPMAYAIVLEALSIPLILMLVALIFRGVAFEFRFKASTGHRDFWDKAFIIGSIVATFTQCIAVGALIQGIDVEGRHFVGTSLDWLTPFSLFCGLGLVAAYALLGCTWLIMKTEHELQALLHRVTKPILLVLLAILAILSIWTPLLSEQIASRWFSLPNLYFFLPVPILVAIFSVWMFKAIQNEAHYAPFILTLGLVFLGYTGLGISIWPNIIPPNVSMWQAAAPIQSQIFMLIGTLAIIPIILMYTMWSYFVFRGKVSEHEGYH